MPSLQALSVTWVEILERIPVEGRGDPVAKLRVEPPLALDLVGDEGLPGEQRIPVRLRLEHRAHARLVEVTDAVLAVARDEGNGGALLGEREYGSRGGAVDPRQGGRQMGFEIHGSRWLRVGWHPDHLGHGSRSLGARIVVGFNRLARSAAFFQKQAPGALRRSR